MESCLTALNPWPRCHKIIWVTVLIIKITQWWLLDFSPICCSVAQSCLTLRPRGLQPASLPCPSPSPRVCSDSCPLSQWCHPTILSFVVPFSSCLQSFPASGSFPVSQLFTSGGQNIGTPASAIVLRMNIQGWFPFKINWFDLLAVQGTLKSLLQHHSSKTSVLASTSTILCTFRKQWKTFFCVKNSELEDTCPLSVLHDRVYLYTFWSFIV